MKQEICYHMLVKSLPKMMATPAVRCDTDWSWWKKIQVTVWSLDSFLGITPGAVLNKNILSVPVLSLPGMGLKLFLFCKCNRYRSSNPNTYSLTGNTLYKIYYSHWETAFIHWCSCLMNLTICYMCTFDSCQK